MHDDLRARADARRRRALALVEELDLVGRWAAAGRVVLVGAVAYDLVVSRDIDFGVFTPHTPTVADGFAVLAALAEHPRVTKAGFKNALSSEDQGLYWQVRALDDDGHEWSVDLWTLAERHPGPLASWAVEPMQSALDEERRDAILLLKQARAEGLVASVSSIDLYRAVIDGGVRTAAELDAFFGADYAPSLTTWLPDPLR